MKVNASEAIVNAVCLIEVIKKIETLDNSIHQEHLMDMLLNYMGEQKTTYLLALLKDFRSVLAGNLDELIRQTEKQELTVEHATLKNANGIIKDDNGAKFEC